MLATRVRLAAASLAPFPLYVTNTSEEEGFVATQGVDMPSGVVSGDLLLIAMTFASTGAPPTATTPSGWTAVTSIDNYAVFYKVSDGGEGASVTVTTSKDAIGAHNAVRIKKDTFQGTPEETHATGSNASPNPPSETASWGSANNLWIAFGSNFKVGDTAMTGFPSGFTDGVSINMDHDSGDSEINQGVAFLWEITDAKDPGTFTVTNTSGNLWWASTVVVQGV